MSRPLRLLLAGSAILTAVLSVARAAVFWPSEAYLDAVSGGWAALAVDLAHGTFYRPVFGPLGFGGTRYFPLHFSLHAFLIELGLGAIDAGLLMSGLSVLLLSVGVYAVLKTLGAPRWLAAVCGALVPASHTAQEALLSIKGDALPAALSLLGFAAVIGLDRSRRRVVAAAALFTLAFATKVTAVYGLPAALVWLWWEGRRSAAVALTGASAVGFALVIAIVAWGTNGFQAMTAGGTSLGLAALAAAPLSMFRLVREVPETLVFVVLGLAAGVALLVSGGRPARPAWLWLGSTLLLTTPIFMFDGTDTNHLIDLHAAAIVAIGAWLGLVDEGERRFPAAVLAVAGLAASASLAAGLMNASAEQRRGTLRETLALIGDRPGPVLAENALVPIARGEQPYLDDAFMFRLVRERDPGIAEPMWAALREQRFAAVVLERDPHTERGEAWYRYGFFGEGFVDRLEQSYRIAGRAKERVVYIAR